MNLAKLLEGPALVTHRGVSFHSRGGVDLTPAAENFPVDTDAYGRIDLRADENSVKLALTPVGVWTQAVIDVLYRWANPTIGQLVTPRYDIASINTTTDQITLLGALGPRKGCPVKPATFGTLPAAITANVTYFAGVPVPSTPHIITLHTTEAAALAGTGLIDFITAGTGDHMLIEQEPLIVHTYQNRKITFWNAAVLDMPPITFSTKQTLLGQVGFEAFRLNDTPWATANSLYTVTKEVLTDTAPAKADIPTQEYALAWGAAPWDAFRSRGPVTFTPTLATTEITDDPRGLASRKISGIEGKATAVPHGMSEEQLLDALQIQGGTIARGKSRVRSDLIITGTGVYVRLPNAAARVAPQQFSPTDPRAGTVEWEGSRAAGAAAFTVALAAP